LTINKSGITLQKNSGSSGEVVIDGKNATYVITLSNASNVVLSELTIKNGYYTDIYATGSNNVQILNCKLTDWALIGRGTTSAVRAAIYTDGCSNWTIQGNNLDNTGHGNGPQSDADYSNDANAIQGILFVRSSGGHRVLDNVFTGAYQSNGTWVYTVNDFLTGDDWTQPNNSFNNSVISGNQFYGAFDDLIQVDGNNNNVTISNNYMDGRGCRALISINPCYNGPVYIKDNILKNWGPGYVGLKMGAFTGSANGVKYVTNNIGWSKQGTFMGSTNGSAGNVHFLNNKLNVPRIQYGISCVEDSGNTNSSFAEPTTADWNGSIPTPPSTPTPNPTPTPTPSGNIFGLSSGNNVWTDNGNCLNCMRFQNTAGEGSISKLEILYNTTSASGKVRMGVYADNNGKPGNRLLDAGETSVANGWTSISNLSLPVTANTYYWLAFNQQTANGVAFLSSSANSSQCAHYWANGTAYGPLPATFNLNNCGNNLGPYVMRATVNSTLTPVPAENTFGLNSGNSTWDQKAGVLDAMRFLNTAGSGTLNKLELLFADSTPSGKVRFGVYADNNGKPGNCLLDAGETSVANGWTSISNLSLPVTANTYYWLACDMQSGNTARYQNGQAADSHYWTNYGYGLMPGTFPTSGLSTNNSPYVMRATVIIQ